MSKEIFKVDKELANEFDELIQDEGRKIEPEERTRKALWALDTLKQEKKINSETTLKELIQIVENRKKELRQTNAYAKDTLQNPVTDEVNVELHKVAKEEAKTSERLLGYMEAVWSKLILMKMSSHDPETPLSQIQDKLKGELQIMKTAIDRSEESQRHRNK